MTVGAGRYTLTIKRIVITALGVGLTAAILVSAISR
jgi:hypothetical protein